MRNSEKRILLAGLILVVSVLVLPGCAKREAEQTEEKETLQPVIEIESEELTEEETLMLPMALEEEILPALGDVTTAEENSVLSPVYLQVGDVSPVVETLQKVLMELGYMDNDEPTTYFGEATKEAIQKFQRQIGMTQDGILGPETWDKLISQDAPYYQVKNGDEGNDIAQIQQRLYQLGYLADDSVTGYFGDTTEAAVRKMQERNGISVDGTVGKESTNLLYSDEVIANLIGLGEESELVKAYQQRLILLGYLTDEADGKFGTGTYDAVKKFQSINALIVDGYLGPDTRNLLESSEAKPFGLRLGDGGAELYDSIIYVQKRLVKYNYLTSKSVTGYYGDLTKNAVIKFQECNGLTADGTVGQKTMAKLKSDNAVKKPANVEVKESGTKETKAQTTAAAAASGEGQTQTTAHTDAGSGTNSSVASGPDTSGASGGLVSLAYSKLGCSYVYGSKGPNTFDCSGFVYWCLNQSGVSQSYLTSAGWRNPGRYTRISDFDSIQAGDIVVVYGHVGIAAGSGTVIDASSSNGRVVHRSLSNWWRNNFIVAWRIF